MPPQEERPAIVMQMTVSKGGDGFIIDTRFAEGYDEEALADVFERWIDEEFAEREQAPGWGRP